MANNEQGRKENYVGNKFLIQDYKSVYKNIVKISPILKNYGVSSSLRDTVIKTFFDTDDMFFSNKGINISTNVYKNRPYADLVIRYNSEVKRIEFLNNLPDTFIKKISKKDKIYNYYEFIANAVLELLPSGINVDALEAVRKIKTKLIITKKRDRYRVINSNGFKVILSFEQSIYQNVKRDKIKLNLLELRMDCSVSLKPHYDKFVHDLLIEEFRLVKVSDNDLMVGKDYLNI